MKTAIKKVTAVILVVAIFVTGLSVIGSAASISKDKHKATKVNSSQTVYIKSNTGWNTELPGDFYQTKIKVKFGSEWFELFQKMHSTDGGKLAKMRITIYKKTNSGWTKYKDGKYNCDNKGYTSEIMLKGKGVNYKIVFTPVVDEVVADFYGINAPDQYDDMSVIITSYGTITSVK